MPFSSSRSVLMKSWGSLSERIMFKLQIVTAGKLTRYKGRKIQLKVLKSRRIVRKQSFWPNTTKVVLCSSCSTNEILKSDFQQMDLFIIIIIIIVIIIMIIINDIFIVIFRLSRFVRMILFHIHRQQH